MDILNIDELDVPAYPYREEELWTPLSQYISSWDISFHQLLCADSIRVRSYDEAISAALFEVVRTTTPQTEIVCYDLGTGTGILSIQLLRSWEALWKQGLVRHRLRLFAIEGDPTLAAVARDNFAEATGSFPTELAQFLSTQVINESLYSFFSKQLFVSIEEKAHLVISELLGNIADSEDGMTLLDWALRALLRPGGISVPTSIYQYCVPIQSEAVWMQRSRNEFRSISPSFVPRDDSSVCFFDSVLPQRCSVSYGALVTAFNLNQPETLMETYETKMNTPLTRDCEIHGLKFWFRARLFGDVWLDLSPSGSTGIPPYSYSGQLWDFSRRRVSDCWKHGLLLFDTPVRGKAGGDFGIQFMRSSAPDSEFLDYYVEAGGVCRSLRFKKGYFTAPK